MHSGICNFSFSQKQLRILESYFLKSGTFWKACHREKINDSGNKLKSRGCLTVVQKVVSFSKCWVSLGEKKLLKNIKARKRSKLIHPEKMWGQFYFEITLIHHFLNTLDVSYEESNKQSKIAMKIFNMKKTSIFKILNNFSVTHRSNSPPPLLPF